MVLSNEEQFSSPAHHTSVNIFSGTTEGTEQVWEQVAGSNKMQELLMPVLPLKGTPTQRQPPFLSKSGLWEIQGGKSQYLFAFYLA